MAGKADTVYLETGTGQKPKGKSFSHSISSAWNTLVYFLLLLLFLATPRGMKDHKSPHQGSNRSPLQWKCEVS